MSAQVASNPPLGQVTCLKSDTVFTLESESALELGWEAQIWHNIGTSEWTALCLCKCSATDAPLLSCELDPRNRLVLSGELSRPGSGTAQFTIRYRESPDAEWRWTNKEQNLTDGELIFTTAADLTLSGFSKYFDELSPDVEIENRKSESPGAALWHLSGPVEAAHDNQSGYAGLDLGLPASVSRFFALVRASPAWLGPTQGNKLSQLRESALLCSFLRTDGVNMVLLGVSGVDDVLTTLGCDDRGMVRIIAQNDNARSTRFQVLAAAAEEFEVAMSAIIYEARKLVRPYNAASDNPEAQWLSSWYDGLTYCTWNGIGQDLTEEKILSALDDLSEKGINISDDKGPSAAAKGWMRFEANSSFPEGLRKTVSAIREKQPNINHIAVWHALLGYWGGISPDGELAATYKTKEVAIRSAARETMLAIDPDDVQRFYNDFYAFLSTAGITGVKADAQSFLDLLRDPEDRRRFTSAYQDAWSISSLRYFGPKVISCMSQFPQAIFHSQLPTNKPTIVARNSDDFFPDVEDSHTWHVFCNAHNALLTRYLNVLPDWDMFQTSHPYAAFHAAARSVSGGPIYITDTPTQHNMTILNQITAQTIKGSTIILRPSLVGRTLDMYNSIDEGHILRIGTYTGRAKTGSGILGLFNLSPATKSILIPMIDFPGIYDTPEAENTYIVRAHTTGKIAGPLHPTSTASVKLQSKEWEILTAYPTSSFNINTNPHNTAPIQIAALGLLGKMTGVAALIGSDAYVASNGRLRVDVALKALGILGIYISDLSGLDIDEHFMITMSGKPVPRKTVWKEDGKVLAVDIGQAWKEMDLEAGWGNEVHVSVFLSLPNGVSQLG
ncbi:raffinose synthase or seed imbibition protein Sip1-domain-containing protein [Aspergillus egyptiacus]|nr:raffinose synthase or seed imbibition protein Sip1-domain-containing protein [Aspergillus egyptiacus]